MKNKHIIAFQIGFVCLIAIVFSIGISYLTNVIQEVKPRESKTMEDYHNLIEDSKNKIDEMAQDKWLRVSDIKKALNSDYSGRSVLKSEYWRELLKKAEDSRKIYIAQPTAYSQMDIRLGITADQIIQALKSVDPNYIKPKKPNASDLSIEWEF